MLFRIRNLKKVHGGSTILDINSLDIQRGEAYTLIGPNGAGKTTLLNILAFLDLPSSGDMLFQGNAVQFNQRELHALRQKVVQVDQYPILFTGTVRKNIEYGLHVRRVEKKKKEKIVEEVLKMVGMHNFIDADAQTLSGGETKRVALARALAIEPDVLLCDEPTANVDVENQKIIIDILKRCNGEKNVSLIFATHSLSEASHFADHTIELRNGRIASGNTINVFSARLQKSDEAGSQWLIADTLTYRVVNGKDLPGSFNKVYVDPKKIRCAALNDSAPMDENLWKGRITKAERVGDEVRLTVDCGVAIEVLMSCEKYERKALPVNQKVGLNVAFSQNMFCSEE
jgi:tungstate transport system ATP-binding protein